MSERAGTRTALLVDFGGVLTTDVFGSFRAFSTKCGAAAETVAETLIADAVVSQALVEHECGRLDDEGFEAALAAGLARRGLDVAPEGLLHRLLATIEPDVEMLDLVSEIRAAGIPVAVVSNQLGRDLYAGYQLEAIADVVVLSADVGVRKPSRRIYAIACERIAHPPERCVLVDDLEHNLIGAARLGIAGVRHVRGSETRSVLSRYFPLREVKRHAR